MLVYILSQGQIVGIIVGCFAIFVVGLVGQRWFLAGAGVVIALTKFQICFIPVIALLLLWDTGWLNKIKVLLIPLINFASSFLFYPG